MSECVHEEGCVLFDALGALVHGEVPESEGVRVLGHEGDEGEGDEGRPIRRFLLVLFVGIEGGEWWGDLVLLGGVGATHLFSSPLFLASRT